MNDACISGRRLLSWCQGELAPLLFISINFDNMNCVIDMSECRYLIIPQYHSAIHNVKCWIIYINHGHVLFNRWPCFDDVATTQKIDVGNSFSEPNPKYSMTASVTYGSLHKDCYTRAIKSVPSSIYFCYTTSILIGPWCNTLKDTMQSNCKSEVNVYNWLYHFWSLLRYGYAHNAQKRSENQSLLPDEFFPQVIAQSLNKYI